MSEELDPEDERDVLAAEYVLRLLDGEALLTARGRIASDPGFAAAVADWEGRLAALHDNGIDQAPPSELWDRIERALNAQSQGDGEVVRLGRRERWWRGYAAAMTAVAASLALVLSLNLSRPVDPAQPGPGAQPNLVAALASEDGAAALSVTLDPETATLIVAPARLATSAGHDHELWLIPPSGTPVSLGLINGSAPQRRAIPAALLPSVGTQSTIAVSVEPTGGSPTGLPTGPVIASAALARV